MVADSIHLTRNRDSCSSYHADTTVGSIYFDQPLPFPYKSQNRSQSLNTKFTVAIYPPIPNCLPGDGLAFVMTSNDVIMTSMPTGSFGLPNSPTESSYFSVELDTFMDTAVNDLNENHLGINLNGLVSSSTVNLWQHGVHLNSGRKITVWIDYSDTEKVAKVWLSYGQTKPYSTPILMAPMDLSEVFGGYIYVGLTASNGKGTAVHEINSWYFKTSSMEEPEAGPDNCDVCFPAADDQLNRLCFPNVLVWFVVSVIVIGSVIGICFPIVYA